MQFPMFKLNQTLLLAQDWRGSYLKDFSQKQGKYVHKNIFITKIKLFVENGHDHNHILAIINEKGNSKNQTNDDSNIK